MINKYLRKVTSRFRQLLTANLKKPIELHRLRAENVRYRSLIDLAPFGYLTINSQTRIVETNRVGAALLGKSPGRLQTTRLADLLPTDDIQSLYDRMKHLEHGCSTTLSTELKSKGKVIPVMLYLTAAQAIRRSGAVFHVTVQDLSAHKEAEDNLRIARDGLYHIANHDSLTRLPNRAGFHDRLETAVELSRINNNRCALLLLNLDCFSRINDPLGHKTGDKLLREVANRLKMTVTQNDTIGRLGGDEFGVIIENAGSDESTVQIAKKISVAISRPYISDGHEIPIAASIGVSIYPGHAKDNNELMRFATAAMRDAKSDGHNRVRLFTPGLNTTLRERFELENDLRDSIRDAHFELYFQPQYDIANRDIVSYEALLRWNHPTQGLLAPDSFIDIVEETGLIEPLGEWIITEACTRLSQLRTKGNPAQRISVNVSAKQFASGSLCGKIEDILKSTNTPAHALELELTESALFDDLPNGIEVLERLKSAGVAIAIDDFGTGYSSLSRLQQLPASRVKIDKSFIHDIPENKNNKAIVNTIISLSHNLGMEVVAEGVETHRQALFLSKAGCDYLQGYYVGRPQPFARVASAAKLKTVEPA